MLRRASSETKPAVDPLAIVHERAAEALALIELTIQPGPGVVGATRRKVNQLQHGLETARIALRRVIHLSSPR